MPDSILPEYNGAAVDKEYFDSLVKRKAQLDGVKEYQKRMKSLGRWGKHSNLFRNL